jgi:hypothetical protein
VQAQTFRGTIRDDEPAAFLPSKHDIWLYDPSRSIPSTSMCTLLESNRTVVEVIIGHACVIPVHFFFQGALADGQRHCLRHSPSTLDDLSHIKRCAYWDQIILHASSPPRNNSLRSLVPQRDQVRKRLLRSGAQCLESSFSFLRVSVSPFSQINM